MAAGLWRFLIAKFCCQAACCYAVRDDVDYTAMAGISIKGEAWHWPDDTFGLAGVMNGLPMPT
jgi:hypothetical protein